jgi:hypothetical protein
MAVRSIAHDPAESRQRDRANAMTRPSATLECAGDRAIDLPVSFAAMLPPLLDRGCASSRSLALIRGIDRSRGTAGRANSW